MFLNLQSNKLMIFIFKIIRKISYDFSNKISKKLLKGQTYSPWILDKNIMKCDTLIYNTVDGQINRIQLKNVYNEIKKIDYISIRNCSVYDDIKKINNNCYMFPDSVINVSKIIDISIMEDYISPEIKKFVNDNDYYIFQSNKKIGNANYKNIIQGISETNKKCKLKCLLLPIGFAQGHEDPVVLKKIKKSVENTFFYDNINIYEIIYLIKNSRLFIGTSLHGLITSISYGIPHMAYTNKIKKQINFLNTWKTTSVTYTDSINMCKNVDFIIKNYEKEKNKVENQKIILQNEVDKNFRKINDLLKRGLKNGQK